MKKVLSVFVVICFIATGQTGVFPVYAQDYVLPAPGVMVPLSPAFDPPILTGIKVHPDDPLRFDFILDKRDNIAGVGLRSEASKLIKYFLASLTIPEKDLWVNLSPYEKDRIIPQSFGLTEMGRDLLAEDYMLKQITASLIYPEGETGRKFWKRVYEESALKFGTTNIPVNTFNKVWIVPEKAVVYENAKAGTAYVVEARLKVMLEEDYLSLKKHKSPLDSSAAPQNDVNALGSQIVRAIVIPELTREVNEGKNFAQLRQVYNSLILATWYKKKIRESILEKVYADKKKIVGVGYKGAVNVNAIYQRYLEAFKKGVYNYIKEEQDPISEKLEPRKYFSGGEELIDIDKAMVVTQTIPRDFLNNKSDLAMISTEIKEENPEHSSMWGKPLPGEDSREELISLIEADVRKAYEYAARNINGPYNGNIWAAKVCYFASEFLFDQFRGRDGIGVKVVRYESENKAGIYDANFHEFIIIFFKGRVWILDPTWQQFLKKDGNSSGLPRVLLVDVARLYEKLDAMKVLKDNRHYWYSGLARDPLVMGKINKEPLYQGFVPKLPQYYLTARSKLTNPQGLFHFIKKSIYVKKDLDPLNMFDLRVQMYSLDDRQFGILLADLKEGAERLSGLGKKHFEMARNYYLYLRQDGRNLGPVTDVFDYVFGLFKEKILQDHQGLIMRPHSMVRVGSKDVGVDIIRGQSGNLLFVRIGGLVLYNEEFKGSIQDADIKFLGLNFYPILNDHFPNSGESLNAVITSIAWIWANWKNIQRKTVIDYQTSNGIAGIMAEKMGAREVIFVPLNDSQREVVDTNAGEYIYPPEIYSDLDQIPLKKREDAVLIMNTADRSFVDQAMLTNVYINRLTAKASNDVHLPDLNKTAIPNFLKLSESAGRKHQWLYTKLINVKDLPADYPVALREPDFYKILPGFINVNLPESDIILTSYASNGSSGVLRLGSLEDGTPVALKARYSSSVDNDNERIMGDYGEAFILDMLGIGPRLHGLFKDQYHRINIVMDIVPGDVLNAAREFITPVTVEDLGAVNERLRMDERSMSFDMNYLVTPAGRILLIDPERINGARVDPDDNAYIRYLFELLEAAKPKVQRQAIRALRKNKEMFTKIENYIDQQEKGKNTGGIDLTGADMHLETQNAGEGIKFRFDPAMLQELQNAAGFVPVIINIQPLTDLKVFLGAADEKSAPLA